MMKRSMTARTTLCALQGGCAIFTAGIAVLALGGASYAQPADGNGPLSGESATGQGNQATLLADRGAAGEASVDADGVAFITASTYGQAARPVLTLPSLVSAGLEMSEQSIWDGARQGPGLFGDMIYQDVKFDFDGLTSDVRLKGASFGGAYRLNDIFSAGGALRRDNADIRFGNGDRQDYSATTLTGFLRYAEASYGLTAAVSHSWLNFEDGVRQAGVQGLATRTGFDGHAWQLSLLSDVSYEWGALDMTLSNNLHYDAIRIDGAAESGATGLALRYGDQSLNTWRFDTHLDVRMDGWRVSDTVTLTPVGAVAWNLRSNADHSLVSQLVDNPADPVTLFGEGLAEHSFETRLGVEAQIAERFTAGLSYGRGWGNDRHSDDRIALTVRARF